MLLRKNSCVRICALFFLALSCKRLGGEEEVLAKGPIESSGIRGGLLVYLGRGEEGSQILELSDRFLVHCLDSDLKRVERKRQAIQAKGLYGQVTVEHWVAKTLPYADDLVDLIVADDWHVSEEEVVRVLRPHGVAYLKRGGRYRRLRKPRPEGTDQWTHQWHGPDGNVLSRDKLVGVPTGIRWIMGPLAPMQGEKGRLASQALVTANGRVFFITRNDLANLGGQTSQDFLIARNAFNGLFLWKRPWKGPGGGYKNSNPRIVAVGERLYVTDGDEPVSLDAATGRTLQSYPCEGVPQRLIHTNGCLAIESSKGLTVYDAPTAELRWRYRTKGVESIAKAPRGRQQWRFDTKGIISTLISHNRVFFLERCLDGDGRGRHDEVVCLDLRTGRRRWRKSLQEVGLLSKRRSMRLCFAEEKVLALVEENALSLLSTQDGRELWSRRTGASSKWWTYHRFAGHFFKDGQVWMRMVDTAHALDSQESWLVLDPLTGRAKRELKSKGNWPRSAVPGKVGCQPIFATERFIVYPRQATLLDFETGAKHHNKFFRGSCVLGAVPANGLFYVVPHCCGCFPELLRGFIAVKSVPDPEKSRRVRAEGRLVKGPVFPSRRQIPPPVEDGWPTYRGDPQRSASSECRVPTDLSKVWEVQVTDDSPSRSQEEWRLRAGSTVTSPAVMGGKVFVARPNSHRVVALEAETGKETWRFTAGGRVDTPPTIYRGLCLFGAHDGRVYCLRSSDGKLVWRFLAAPRERRIVAYGQLESLWPVAGSVLLQNGLACFAAGRAPDGDGGLFVYGIEPGTGRLIWQKNIRDGSYGLCDIMVGDGKSLYLLRKEIDPKTGEVKPVEKEERFLTGGQLGLLEATWTRNSRILRKNIQSWRYGGVAGQILAFSKKGIASYTAARGRIEFHPRAAGFEGWSVRTPPPMQVEAMVLTRKSLFVAGPSDGLDRKGKGGFLWGLSIAGGKKTAEMKLAAPPVFDGLAAAYGRLYVSTQDGKLLCLGKN